MGLFSRKKKEPPAPPAQTVKASVLVCTNNRNTVEALVPVLEQEHLAIKGILWESAEILERYQAIRPDFVMLDNDLNGQDGLEMLRELREAHPGAVVVFLGTFFESSAQAMVARAITYGAKQILAKNKEGKIPAENIRGCLDKVMDAAAEKKASELQGDS